MRGELQDKSPLLPRCYHLLSHRWADGMLMMLNIALPYNATLFRGSERMARHYAIFTDFEHYSVSEGRPLWGLYAVREYKMTTSQWHVGDKSYTPFERS